MSTTSLCWFSIHFPYKPVIAVKMQYFVVGSRSPSPAPSSGVESSSIKDSPLQIDLASDGGNVGKNVQSFVQLFEASYMLKSYEL